MDKMSELLPYVNYLKTFLMIFESWLFGLVDMITYMCSQTIDNLIGGGLNQGRDTHQCQNCVFL